MRRRSYLAALATTAVGGSVVARGDERSTEWNLAARASTVGSLEFDSTSSLLAPDETILEDDSVVAVWAEPTASNTDADGNGDAVSYPDDVDVPMVGVDGDVAGLGCPLVTDDANYDAGNEEFVLNLWDSLIGGGTVLWDEGHGQFYALSKFGNFENYVEGHGYDVQATTSLTDDLSSADGVVVTSPSSAFSDAELSALSDFVADGGAVVLHDQSDFRDFDATDNINELAEALGAGFRFNDDQVVDYENNGGVEFVPKTSNFNPDFALFDDRPGIDDSLELSIDETYEVTVTSVADGDTVDVEFPSGVSKSVRVLGIDTPETAANADAEDPYEWEGLAYDTGPDPVDELVFDTSSSLLAADGTTLDDDSVVAVHSEPTAGNSDADGNGDAVDYGTGEIPLVAVDGSVVGVTAQLVTDDADFGADNDEFLLNVWDQQMGGSGTVLWDESHDQFYTLDKFAEFDNYAKSQGYTVEATDSLADDLPSAEGVVISSPSSAFSDAELSALSDFVADGGAVFLHDQADYRDFDATDNINAVAESLGLAFRFNDDQVVDPENNAGVEFVPKTSNFNDGAFSFFSTREGIDEGAGGAAYPYLSEWASKASDFAKEELQGETVTLSFDPNEGLEGAFGRLLGYVQYDADGSGSRDTLFNAEMIRQGYARVYDSDLAKHDEFWAMEWAARKEGRGLWAEADLSAAPSWRNRPVDDLYFAKAMSVRTSEGRLFDPAPVYAERSASQRLDTGSNAYPGKIPLVGVDDDANVAVVGGMLIDEDFEESDEEFGTDTSNYENFAFLTNLIETLSERDGPILLDGGHEQFGNEYAVGTEDAATYKRYLEGQGITLEQVNDLTVDHLMMGRGIVVTSPASEVTADEKRALRRFADAGGVVVLMSRSDAPREVHDRIDDVAADLGTDLRLNRDDVVDGSSNVGGRQSFPVTGRFDRSFPYFSAFEGLDVTGDGLPAANLDDDPFHEDVNGDGEASILDVQALFDGVSDDDPQVVDNPSKFDVDGDGRVTILDVQKFFAELL